MVNSVGTTFRSSTSKLTSLAHQRYLALVVILLLLQTFLRTTHIVSLEGFIDEGFHARRADIVWDFDQNPGRFAHGKVLLYFWLGLFESSPTHNLVTYRFAMAIFSLITGGAIYAIGKRLGTPFTGLMALALYGLLPFAVFFDRMALADPLAAGLVTLVAWRSLVFADYVGAQPPSPLRWREGVIIGVLLGLSTMAKLTVGLIPLLPGLTALFYFTWRWDATLPQQCLRFLKIALPPMLLTAGIVILMWLPMLIPAYQAQDSEQPFNLVDGMNQRIGDEENKMAPQEYLRRIAPTIETFTSQTLWWMAGGFLILVAAASLYKREGEVWRGLLFLLAWALLLAILSILTAQLIRSRYFMPLSAPLCLWFAVLITYAWRRIHPVVGAGLAIGMATWVLWFPLPTINTFIDNPYLFELDSENWIDYQSGYFLSDAAVANAVQDMEAQDPPPTLIYAPWNVCHLAYFQTDLPITCLDQTGPIADIRQHLQAELGPEETAYIIFADYRDPFFQQVEGLGSQQISRYERQNIRRPVTLWKVWWVTPPK